MAKRAAARRRPPLCTLRIVDPRVKGDKKPVAYPIAASRERVLQQAAMQWSYKARHRARWADHRAARDELGKEAVATFTQLGVDRRALAAVARAEIVEIEIPYVRESVNWAARVFPWEFVLAVATRKERGERALIVVRRLVVPGAPSQREPWEPKSAVCIEASPIPFGEMFDFEAESEMMRASLVSLAFEPLTNPTKRSLAAELRERSPDVIHITGLDSRLGAQLADDPPEEQDGIYLSHPTDDRELVVAEDVGKVLTAGSKRRPPMLVGFNVWESAARIAPLTIAAGARAAIGFQLMSDDAVSEQFFVHFYRACIERQWRLLPALAQAWLKMKPYHHRIRGDGIVLWSADSLLDDYDAAKESPDVIRRELEACRELLRTRTRAANPACDHIGSLVRVNAKPLPQLNYAALHNGASALRKLTFRFLPEPLVAHLRSEAALSTPPIGVVHDLEVNVQLNFGADSFPYRTRLSIGAGDELFNLADRLATTPREENPPGGVSLALTSELARSIDESILTSLFVEVLWHGQVLYRHTHPVRLDPVDQWKLDEVEIRWLPSFIYPRDPAIARIVADAQARLKQFPGFSQASFCGYQEDDEESVAKQVEAIWLAIAEGRQLGYIEPPPSYRENSQRLRTPSQVVNEGRGTCIDLTLLLAACLEWVGIHSVIIMLDNHAFPGYWTNDAAYKEFLLPRGAERVGPLASDDSLPFDAAPWIVPRSGAREVKNLIFGTRTLPKSLVPLEAVELTTDSTFNIAIGAAKAHFTDPDDVETYGAFHSMVDVDRARESVTPLPLERRPLEPR